MKALLLILALAFIVFVAGNAKFMSPDPLPEDFSLTQQDSFNQQAAIDAILKSIEGREEEPAEDVFENIQLFGKMPAGRIIRVMEMGFSRSLGVNCTHCHNPADWASEEKPAKQVARDMMNMVGEINSELLKAIPNLESEQPAINCTTCHRGQVVPATNME